MLVRRLDPSRDALLTLSVLLIVDAAFVLVHVLHDAGKGSGGRLKHERYSLETDRGLAELFGYAKEGLVVIALFSIPTNSGARIRGMVVRVPDHVDG